MREAAAVCRRALAVVGLALPLAWACAVLPASAQTQDAYTVEHRPPGAPYRLVRSAHFDVIFEAGREAEAADVAATLEAALPAARALFGHTSSFRMPVVLSSHTDRGNGFVRPVPFKQDLVAAPIKGDLLSPRHADWWSAVAPHELAHAVHADLRGGIGVMTPVRWVAPDLARATNLWGPPGLAEGWAVYFESRAPGAGRLHHGPFTMQYEAALLSGRPWSLYQMLERPAFERPYDRFYPGGAHLVKYFAEQGRLARLRRAVRLHYRFPFLGSGLELWLATGRPPWRIARDMRQTQADAARTRIAALGPLTAGRVVHGRRGLHVRRPQWLDDETLLVYADGYDVLPGLYTIDVATGRREPVHRVQLTEDVHLQLAPGRDEVYFTRYVTDPLHPARRRSMVFAVDVASGRPRRVTDGGGWSVPAVLADGTLWAARGDGPFNAWTAQDAASGAVHTLGRVPRGLVKHIAPLPDGRTAALIVHQGGRQHLWRAEVRDGVAGPMEPWLGLPEAAVYDAAWTPDGRHLLFTADPRGVTNVFAWSRATGRVHRLTNVAFGARDPAVSPDGRTLAFVRYAHERFELVTIPFAPDEAPVAPHDVPSGAAGEPGRPTTAPDVSEPEPYRAWRHLAPRMLYPTVYWDGEDGTIAEPTLGVGAGLAVEGADPLQRWAYRGEAFVRDGRLWGRASLRNGRLLVRPTLRAYDVPVVRRRAVPGAAGVPTAVRVGVEQRGVAGSLRLPVVLRDNVRHTGAVVHVGGELRQERVFDDGGYGLDEARTRLTLTPAARYYRGLQARPRDLVPYTGLSLQSALEWDVAAWDMARGRGAVHRAYLYLPWLGRLHGGLRLDVGLLQQNQAGLLGVESFVPRGQSDRLVGRGATLRYGLEATQPLWYVDDGFFLVPIYVQAVYAYGFGEAMHAAGDRPSGRDVAVGAGLGLRVRAFYLADLDLRIGAALQPASGRWDVVWR